jgi:D-sedoheptulose 7-phosphate isomerase
MTAYKERLREAIDVFKSLRDLESGVRAAAACCVEALKSGHKLLICGNGGSASEAQHLAGELMGHYQSDRPSLAAVALGADSAVLTCIGNDYRFDEIFSRQVRGLGNAGDVLVAFTTSGNSPNILNALAEAREREIKTIAFLGGDGGKARGLSDYTLIVRHPGVARAQEGHQFLMHALMDAIEDGVR